MKEPLKVGDKVKMYDHLGYSVGVITKVDGDFVEFATEDEPGPLLAHRKQVRRLVKRKRERREWWLVVNANNYSVSTNTSLAEADSYCRHLNETFPESSLSRFFSKRKKRGEK